MFNYDVMRNQWVMLAMFGGVVFVLFVVVTYLDLWQPRKKKKDSDETETNYLSLSDGIPMSLKGTYIVLTIFTILYIIYRILNPPNW